MSSQYSKLGILFKRYELATIHSIFITLRLATAVYDRTNFTILDVLDLSDPLPTNYTAAEFFNIFDLALKFDARSTDSYLYTAFQFLNYLTQFLAVRQGASRASLNFEGTLPLRQLIAVPILVFNNQFMEQASGVLPSQNRNRTASLVNPGYQVSSPCSQLT
jgi:hypothetical protein